MAASAARPDGPHDYAALSRTWTQLVWNEAREEVIDQMMSPDCRVRVEGLDEPLSPREFRDYLRIFRQAVPDVQGHVLSVTAEGERTVMHWRITGTHLGPGLGVPPTGRPINIVGLTIFLFSDGLIVGGEDHWNRGEFLASLMRVEVDEIRERFGLTERVAQVALLMAERMSHKEIAQHLGIRPNTARRHCEAVLKGLGISSRSGVARVLGKVSGSISAVPGGCGGGSQTVRREACG